jgi:hypothetical protein
MTNLTITNGVATSRTYIQATRQHECTCGTKYAFELQLPEGVIYQSKISINGINCPSCGNQAVIPMGTHYVENYQLLTREV